MLSLWTIVVIITYFKTSICLEGENVCQIEEIIKVNVTKFIPKLVTVRHYQWCLKVPPRCAVYSKKQINETKLVEEEQTLIRDLCCPGYTEKSGLCVLECNNCVKRQCYNFSSCYCQDKSCFEGNQSNTGRNQSCELNRLMTEELCSQICKCPLAHFEYRPSKNVTISSTGQVSNSNIQYHDNNEKTKEQSSKDGTLDLLVNSNANKNVTEENSHNVSSLKGKADGMEVNGSGATTEGGPSLRNRMSSEVMGTRTKVDLGGNGALFYGLIILAGMGSTITVIIATCLLFKLKHRRNIVDSSANCCKVHFINSDNYNTTHYFEKTNQQVSPDLLQHQETKNFPLITQPEILDFPLKFSSQVSKKYPSNENIYDEIRTSKEGETTSSFYVNLNRANIS